jgi:hypothetical protein
VSGKTTPRWPDVLELLDKTHRLLDFVSLFADPRDIEPVRPAYVQRQKHQRIAYGMPWSRAILHALGWRRERLPVAPTGQHQELAPAYSGFR